jgi:V/A-type H+/Na+-transporting ATPase subunit C
MSTTVSMPSKIFGTVLSHGLRGRMLSKNELHTLAESRDIDELVTRMKNTVYLDALAKLPKPYTAEKAESALREYLVNVASPAALLVAKLHKIGQRENEPRRA